MDVEKTSKDLVDECKVVSCEKERESGFCFQKYSKDEIFRIFHGLVYTPSSFEISEISKFRRKFRYFGVIFFGLHRGLRDHKNFPLVQYKKTVTHRSSFTLFT